MIYKRYLGAYIAHCWTFPLRICFTLNRRGGNLQDKNGLTFFFVQTYIWGIGQWCQRGWKKMKCCFMILVLWKDTKQRGHETNVVQCIVLVISIWVFEVVGKSFRKHKIAQHSCHSFVRRTLYLTVFHLLCLPSMLQMMEWFVDFTIAFCMGSIVFVYVITEISVQFAYVNLRVLC